MHERRLPTPITAIDENLLALPYLEVDILQPEPRFLAHDAFAEGEELSVPGEVAITDGDGYLALGVVRGGGGILIHPKEVHDPCDGDCTH